MMSLTTLAPMVEMATVPTIVSSMLAFGAAGAYAIFRVRAGNDFMTKASHSEWKAEMERRHAENVQRLEAIESRQREMPSRGEVAAFDARLRNVETAVSATVATMGSVEKAVDRVERMVTAIFGASRPSGQET